MDKAMFEKMIPYQVNWKNFKSVKFRIEIAGDSEELEAKQILDKVRDAKELKIDDDWSIGFDLKFHLDGVECSVNSIGNYKDELLSQMIKCYIEKKAFPSNWYFVEEHSTVDGNSFYFFCCYGDERVIDFASLHLGHSENIDTNLFGIEQKDQYDHMYTNYKVEHSKTLKQYKDFYRETYPGNIISQNIRNKYSLGTDDELIDGVSDLIIRNHTIKIASTLFNIQSTLVFITMILLYIAIRLSL
ncbi:MAG: hypothetical protein QF441_16140 [Bacteriovoracaceae bacterium]|jgi:hypothetical protein|nr:hypothetical protein [Bacteriovoracaceae bacterium]